MALFMPSDPLVVRQANSVWLLGYVWRAKRATHNRQSCSGELLAINDLKGSYGNPC